MQSKTITSIIVLIHMWAHTHQAVSLNGFTESVVVVWLELNSIRHVLVEIKVFVGGYIFLLLFGRGSALVSGTF